MLVQVQHVLTPNVTTVTGTTYSIHISEPDFSPLILLIFHVIRDLE